MDTVVVGERRDVAGLPLPPPARLPGPAGTSAAERGVMTAFLTSSGDLVVDEWCDPVALEVGALALATRAAEAQRARTDARLVSTYLWGAAELAYRCGAPTARERREWGAREMLTELACALRLPEGTLARRLARLTRLDALPRLRDAHVAGSVSAWHLDVVLDVFRGVTDPAILARADEFLVGRAARMTAPELRGCARGWRDRHVPRTEQQRRLNLSARHVEVTPADDDLCWLSALVPAAQAIAIDHRLDELATLARNADDGRSRAELRADAFVDLLLSPSLDGTSDDAGGPDPTNSRIVDAGDATHPENEGNHPHTGVDARTSSEHEIAAPPSGGAIPEWVRGVTPEVVLTVPVLSLLGHSEEPAELEGWGPIDLDTARQLCALAPSFTRVLTHPETGAVLSVGRDRYRIPKDLERAVRLRDRTCRFPGCRRAATGCDIDHSVAWAHGGSTEAGNLACLCRRHHRLKHEMGWAVTHESNGTLRWRAPTGFTYWTEPGGVWPPRPAPSPRREIEPVPVAVVGGYPDEPPF